VAIHHHILLPAPYQPPLIFTHNPDTTMASGIVVTSAFVQNTLGYSFTDTRLLEEALDTTGLRSPGSNGRLAMIGNSRLKDVILDEWYASGASKGSQDPIPDGSNCRTSTWCNLGIFQGIVSASICHFRLFQRLMSFRQPQHTGVGVADILRQLMATSVSKSTSRMVSCLRRQNHSSDDRNDYFGDYCGKYDSECECCGCDHFQTGA
jgi:hypothetical protein